MSLIKANAVQIGQSNMATENFTLEVPASPDGTIKLARGNAGATTQDVLSVDASGNVSFAGGIPSGNISSSTAIATGSTTARDLANRFADIFNVKDFGAVGDGTTDNQAAFQAAINAALAAGGGTIYIPKGIYNFPNTSNAAKLDPGLGNLTFKGDGYTSSIFKYWEGTGKEQQGNLFSNTVNNPAKGPIIFKDIQIQGSLGIRSGRFGNPMWLDYYPEVLIDSCRFYNIAGMAMDYHYCGSFKCVNSHFENIAADAIRARDTNNCIATGNTLKRIGDDSFAFHTSTTVVGYSQRERIIISNNIVVNGQGVRIIGPKKVSIDNNQFYLSDGITIYGDWFGLEGNLPAYEISITNNTLTDCVKVSGGNIVPSKAISIQPIPSRGGTLTNGVIPGDYDPITNKIILPWENNHGSNVYPQYPIPRVSNLIISGNRISKTVGPVAKYSDYLQGTRLTQGGISIDPAIGDIREWGIEVWNQYENVLISDNIIKNTTIGIIIVPNVQINTPPETLDKATKNITLSNNNIFDAINVGILFNNCKDVLCVNNYVNCDPFRINQYSNIDGSYVNNVSAPLGISGFSSDGSVIKNNIIKNCNSPVSSSNTNIKDNILYCDIPVAEGWNAGNKGIGTIFSTQGFSYVIQDSDPTSATYLQYKSHTIETSNGVQPSSGWYPRGWFVRNMQQTLDANQMTISGWTRLTTGTGHVAGVDWAVARVSNVSPAV
jgi:hypothetical protein